MQDQQDLKPHQLTTTSLKEVVSNSEEHADNLLLEELGKDAKLPDVGHQQNLEQLYEQDVSDKENMYLPNYQNEIEEYDGELTIEKRELSEKLDVSEKDFIEKTEDHIPEKKAKQNTIIQSPNPLYSVSAKPYNSLLLVQEFHTGLTSGDDSGESEDEEDEEEENDDEKKNDEKKDEEEEEKALEEQSLHSPSKAMQPQKHVHVPSRPMDLDFIALKTFRPDASKEENIERNKNLRKYGLFFTRDECRYYIENPIVNPPEDEEYYQEVQNILASIAEKEKKWEASLGDKRKQNLVQESAAKRKRSESPVMGSPSEDFTEIIPDSKNSEPSIKSKPLLNLRAEPFPSQTIEKPAPTPPLSVTSKPNVKPGPQLAVLDTVLTNLLRDSQSAQKSKSGEPSDLEAAAMAAGLDWDTNDTTKSGPQSKLSKQEHMEFLRYNSILKNVS
ncbi:hypothetical protein INT46_001564 [Mucor plumbeus]|uniref:Uncharacterized protein n=1 Tax=Mucor plumbeus TaxID=97098 RepID=A0A8H7R231_9FUNG|nr:hypothetical protein INT46_001564 [Mucor plumbeus]